MKNAIEILHSNYETCFKNSMYWRKEKRWDAAFVYIGHAKELKRAIYILSMAQLQLEEQEKLTRRQKLFSKRKNFWF